MLLSVSMVLALVGSLAIHLSGESPAEARTFCGSQANHPGTTGSSGFSILPGVEAMPRSLVVRTTAGTPANLSGLVDEAIGAMNRAAGVRWRRGPAVAPPATFSTANAEDRPSVGELWVVGNPRSFPRLSPGTYTSSRIQRVGNGPAMPLSTIVVLGDQLSGPTFTRARQLNAVVHEFGHAAGLDHHFTPWQGVCQVMSYGGGTSYGSGDTAGLRLLASRASSGVPPVGNLDLVRRGNGEIRIAGWAVAPNRSDNLSVHLYLNGRFLRATTTSAQRPDVTRAFPTATATAGFTLSIPAPGPSSAQVCAYAINPTAGAPNPLLGCGTAAARSPLGSLDSAGAIPGGVRVRGWALHPDTTDPTAIHVYVNGRFHHAITTGAHRPDVGRVHPAWGDARGFDTTVPAATARGAQICAYAINVPGGGTNPLLGCLNAAGGNPLGSLDEVRPAAEGVTLLGWALDPDTTDPTAIHVYVNGRFHHAITTGAHRPDVGRVHRAWGDARGFDTTVPAATARGAQICAYAINVGPGTTNPLLGCALAN